MRFAAVMFILSIVLIINACSEEKVKPMFLLISVKVTSAGFQCLAS